MPTLTGIDIAWARPTVAQIKATGAKWVARYFSTDPGKNLRASEVTAYTAAGLGIVTVWETTAGRATAGRAAGVADAQAAEQQRKTVGLPDTHIQHFAVDKDTSWASVAPYFAGVASVIGKARTGVYGGIDVIEGAYAAGYRYLWQTSAWSEGHWSQHATIRQTGGTTLSGGADWDTAMVTDFGQYPRPLAPQEQDMTPAQEAKLDQLLALAKGPGILTYRNAQQDAASVKAGKGHILDVYGYLVDTHTVVKAQSATINTLAALAGKNVDTATVVAAVNKAIADATVHVQVDVNDATTTG